MRFSCSVVSCPPGGAFQGFLTLPQNAVVELLSRNSFHAAEIDVFKAICRWIRAQPCMKVITLIAIHWSRNNPALIRELLRQCYLNASYRRSAFGSISYIQRSFWPQSETRSFSQRNALEKLVRNVLDLLYQAIVSDMCGSLGEFVSTTFGYRALYHYFCSTQREHGHR